MSIAVTYTGAGTGDGSQTSPFQSGGIYFTVTGVNGYEIAHQWVVNGQPTHPEMVEMWYGREGKTPSFHPSPKQKLSACRFIFSGEGSTVELMIWVMAFEDEPAPMWSIQCDDGIYSVNLEEFNWLKEGNHIEAGIPRWIYKGTKAQLGQLLAGSNVEIPTEPPNPHPDGKQSLQICYAPIHGFDYDVDGMRRDPTADVEHMARIGAKVINLWCTTQHIYYGTGTFNKTNSSWGWYRDFIDACHNNDMKVCLKLPFWGIPSWFDFPGVPDEGSEKYKQHLDAKVNMINGINTLEPDYLMVGNEPQLLCSQYPYPPVADGRPAPRWGPETILSVTKDVIVLTASVVASDIKLIGPALSGAIQQILPPDEIIPPSEFLRVIAETMAYWNYIACGVNAYQLDVFSKPTYSNYGKFYEELASIYPLWPSEMGVARKNVPSDSANVAHLEAMIEQSKGFSPHIFSYFLYRDFNDDGWGLIRPDDTRDVRIETLTGYFGDGPVAPAHEKVIPVRVRASHNIDAGIQLMNTGTGVITVDITFLRSVSDTSKMGEVVSGKTLELGPLNPVAFNIMRDLDLDVVDAVLIQSDDPVGGLGIWVTAGDDKWNYSGFPAMS